MLKSISSFDRERRVVKIAGKEIKVGGPTPPVKKGERLIRYTQSLCPYCYRLLPAVIVERNNKLYIRRVCPEHGEIEEIYFGDAEMYRRFEKLFYEGRGAGTAYTSVSAPCPFACGLCPLHKSHTSLLNIVVTNRCNLSCWYCFFYAEKVGYVYEPTIEQIVHMTELLMKQQGVVPAVQLTGGEPLVREDIVDIIRALRRIGVKHIQLNTNGIKFAQLYLESPQKAVEFTREVRRAGVNTVYMSFDGVTPRSNPKNHWEIPFIFDTFRKAGVTSVVLVPTLIRGINDGELGDMVRFAAAHMDIVRAVNFQPVSITGLMKRVERERFRITIPDVIHLLEKQTDGQIPADAWYPIPAAVPIARFIEAYDRAKRVEFTTHPACGAATYVYVRRVGKNEFEFIPITHMVDVDGLLEYLDRKAQEMENKPPFLAKIMAMPALLTIIRKYILWNNVPPELRDEFKSMLVEIFTKRSYDALAKFHYKFLFLGMMHFMDLYNYDVQRVMRCVIHYGMPDGRIVPFCTFNILNDLYRDYVQQRYFIPIEEYRKKYGDKAIGDAIKYIRTPSLIEKMTSHPLYKETYSVVMKR